MVPIRSSLQECHDPDVRALHLAALRLHQGRVEQHRRPLECLSAEGLLALGRASADGGYLAEALVAEFRRRLAPPGSDGAGAPAPVAG